MSAGKLIPPGKFVGQVATEWNILFQWDGKRWVRVPEYHIASDGGFIHFDVEDTDPRHREDSVDRAFRRADR